MSPAAAFSAARRPVRVPRLLHAIGWDLRLQVRYHIVTAAAVVTAIYAVLFRLVPGAVDDRAVVLLLFSDPSVLGFLFVGILVLYEGGAQTLHAVAVTPLSRPEYVLSKAASLTLVATASGYVMAVTARGVAFGHAALLAALVLTSLLFVFLGFVGVAHARSVNEYLLIVPVLLAPVNLPVLGLLGVADSPLFYLLPTRASLILFQAAFEPRAAWEIVYAVVFLPIAVVGAYFWARRSFDRTLRVPPGSR